MNSANKRLQILEVENKKLEERVKELRGLLSEYAKLKSLPFGAAVPKQPLKHESELSFGFKGTGNTGSVGMQDVNLEMEFDEELDDAEIIDDENNLEMVQANQLQQIAKQVLNKSKEKKNLVSSMTSTSMEDEDLEIDRDMSDQP